MSYRCHYSTEDYNKTIELSPSEFQEVMDIKSEIKEKKKQLSELLEMYEKQEPSRVYKIPKDINLEKVFNS